MNLPKAYRNFDDLYDRIIFEEDESGSAFGNALKGFGKAYKDKMIDAYNITANPIGLGIKGNNNKSSPIAGAGSASSLRCADKLVANGVDVNQLIQQLENALISGQYADLTGATKLVDLKKIFNKKITLDLKSGNIPLFFNYSNWSSTPTFGNKTLTLDAGYTKFVSNKDTVDLFKSTIASTDYQKYFSNIGTTAQQFKAFFDQFCNDLTDKTTKQLNGYDAILVKKQVIEYIKCISTPIKDFNIKSGGINNNLNGKIFWMFACLPNNTILNKP
jgi:hypothetical protein